MKHMWENTSSAHQPCSRTRQVFSLNCWHKEEVPLQRSMPPLIRYSAAYKLCAVPEIVTSRSAAPHWKLLSILRGIFLHNNFTTINTVHICFLTVFLEISKALISMPGKSSRTYNVKILNYNNQITRDKRAFEIIHTRRHSKFCCLHARWSNVLPSSSIAALILRQPRSAVRNVRALPRTIAASASDRDMSQRCAPAVQRGIN